MSDTEFKVRAGVDYTKKQGRSPSHNQGVEVFFIVDIYELFGVEINAPGMSSCINKAFQACKKYIPVDTGITYRSFTQSAIDSHRIRNYFDINKVVGQTRKGKVVEDYYVQYIAESAKNYSWLTKVIYEYYEVLFAEVQKLINKDKRQIPPDEEKLMLKQEFNKYFVSERIDSKMKQGRIFLQSVRDDYKKRREENDRIVKEREEHRRKQREQYLALKQALRRNKK